MSQLEPQDAFAPYYAKPSAQPERENYERPWLNRALARQTATRTDAAGPTRTPLPPADRQHH